MAGFYRDLLGFQVATEETGRLGLSASGQAPSLFILEHSPAAPPRPLGSSGLFHAAILYPDRAALGRVAQKLLIERVPFATGDHGVSEALYLDDPEGNGVELYADRPVTAWPPPASGDTIGMYTQAVDLDAVIRAGMDHPGPLLPSDTRLGHLHLSVADLRSSEQFYGQRLGFPVTVRSIPGALFLGREGYHHHIGTNVWRSRTPAVDGVLGLARFTITFAQVDEFTRLASALLPQEMNRPKTIVTRDPNGIEVVVTGGS